MKTAITIILLAAALTSCKKSPEEIESDKPQRCRIVDVYHQESWGDDWTTVVETPSGFRVRLSGKRGKEGEEILVNGATLKLLGAQ